MDSNGFSITALHEISRKGINKSKDFCSAMLRIKTNRGLLRQYGKKLAKAICEKHEEIKFDVFIPVPLHKKRELKRGFNQAAAIAEEAGEVLHVPVASMAVLRTKDTKELKNMHFSERRGEIAGSFKVAHKKEIKGKNILIVDDVIASGATIGLLGEVLLRAGAKSLHGAAIFRISRR